MSNCNRYRNEKLRARIDIKNLETSSFDDQTKKMVEMEMISSSLASRTGVGSWKLAHDATIYPEALGGSWPPPRGGARRRADDCNRVETVVAASSIGELRGDKRRARIDVGIPGSPQIAVLCVPLDEVVRARLPGR